VKSGTPQLEGTVWNAPSPPTALVERVLQYRKVPLSDLTIEQLRLLIAQNIGLYYLMPIAIQKLKDNILAEGDFYGGDLLSAVLSTKDKFWERHSGLKQEVQSLITEKQDVIEQSNEANLHRQLLKKIEDFKQK
jgi:hypothetical protein